MTGIAPKNFGTEECIVIFLNDKNLDTLKGYKAEVTKKKSAVPDGLGYRRAYLTITITGLSNKGAENLYDSLVMMNPEEITEFLKEKGFSFDKKKGQR